MARQIKKNSFRLMAAAIFGLGLLVVGDIARTTRSTDSTRLAPLAIRAELGSTHKTRTPTLFSDLIGRAYADDSATGYDDSAELTEYDTSIDAATGEGSLDGEIAAASSEELWETIAPSDLAEILKRGLSEIGDAEAPELDQIVGLADALISLEPDAYGAYKAKAMALLVKEAKFGAPIDEDQFALILLDMAEFGEVDPAFQTTDRFIQEEELVDPDLIKLPFLRVMASGDLSRLMGDATEYLVTYPNSRIGSEFLAQALWRQGNQTAAIAEIRRSYRDNPELLPLVERKFISLAQKDPVHYLMDALEILIDSNS